MTAPSLILYSYFRSSCSYRVRIALNLLNLNYEYRPIHLIRDGGEQLKDDYLKLNPKGEVPLLIHGNAKLTQSMAIIHYLNDISKGELFFKDAIQKAKCIEICEIINSGIQPIQNLKVMNNLVQKLNASDDQKKAWSKFFIEEGFIALEQHLNQTAGKFSMADKPTAADCFLVPQVYNAKRFEVDMTRFPNISRINEECLKLTPFLEASPEVQPDAPK